MGRLQLTSFEFTYLVFSLLGLAVVVFSTTSEFTYFQGESGHKLRDEFIYHEERAFSVVRCTSSCLKNNGCVSFSYQKSERLCRLSKNRLNGNRDPEKLDETGEEWTTCSFSKRCRSGWTAIGETCYFFSEEGLNYTDAKGFCAEKSGKLAEPQSRESFDLLRIHVIDKGTRKYYWIGLNDINEEGRFVWTSNGVEPSYDGWDPDQPNDGIGADCVYLYPLRSYLWGDENCTNPYFKAICEI